MLKEKLYNRLNNALQYLNLAIVVLIFLFSFVAIENNYSDKFQHCIKYYGEREANYYRKQKYPVIVEVADVQSVCTLAAIDRHNGFFALILSGALVLFTFTLARSTEKMMKVADAQGASTAQSIAEAKRAADAMSALAAAMAQNVANTEIVISQQRELAKQQMRAYVAAFEGDIIYQDVLAGLRFSIRPRMRNLGNTPAHNVRYVAKVDIVPMPVPDNFAFSFDEPLNTTATLVPTQEKTMGVIYHRFLEWDILWRINQNAQLKFMVWGTIWYDDVFGDPHHTDFSFYVLCGFRRGDESLWHIDNRHSGVT